MVTVICVNGYPGSGKTTFENYCLEILGNRGHIISSIDWCKKICLESGWDGEKTPETRRFLSDVKDLFSSAPWGDVPLNTIVSFVESLKRKLEMFDVNEYINFVVFVDVREPKNIYKLKELVGAQALLIVREDDTNKDYSNHADANILYCEYEYFCMNNKGLEELKKEASDFVKMVDAKALNKE